MATEGFLVASGIFPTGGGVFTWHPEAILKRRFARGAIEAAGLAYADGKPVTVSVGVAYARAGDGPSDVVERADRALYRAKHAGRNRVVESPLAGVAPGEPVAVLRDRSEKGM